MMRDALKHGIGEKEHSYNLSQPEEFHPCPIRSRLKSVIRLLCMSGRSALLLTFVYGQFGTGARPSEMIALRWGDVNLKRHNPTKTAA